jgi:hypothetical protein
MYKFIAINSMTFFTGIENNDSKIYEEHKSPWIAKAILSKRAIMVIPWHLISNYTTDP